MTLYSPWGDDTVYPFGTLGCKTVNSRKSVEFTSVSNSNPVVLLRIKLGHCEMTACLTRVLPLVTSGTNGPFVNIEFMCGMFFFSLA